MASCFCELRALDLHTAQQRAIWRMPDGFDVSMTSCSADGKYVYSSIAEDKSAEFPVDLLRGYVGFAETWATTQRYLDAAGDPEAMRALIAERP